MKLFILTLMLFTTLNAQIPVDTLMLCDGIAKASYYVKYAHGLQTIWTVEPEVTITETAANKVQLTFEALGTYLLTANQSNNYCTNDPSYLLITVTPCVETTAYIPNAFTPDGDGLNETFGLQGENIKNYRMEIYNRWGELIFITTDLTKAWEGPITKDSFVYSYKITYQDIRNKYYEMYGRITLIK